ncbi:hypothetical protein FWF48_00785 [Candidatus Saccharibacteria bacterium]|nr:hypothetical protein [Candidatus Saccharibacteria bacterium]
MIRKSYILIGIAIMTAIIVTIAVVSMLSSKNNEDLLSNIQDGISSQDSGSGVRVVQVITKNGDWVLVDSVSTNIRTFGETALFVMRKDNGEYKTVIKGSSFGEALMTDRGIPEPIIKAAQNVNVPSTRVQEILSRYVDPREKYPIINSLPFFSGAIEINWAFRDYNDINSFYLIITAPIGFRSVAIQQIYGLGFDPANYSIEFNNYTNPFGGTNAH